MENTEQAKAETTETTEIMAINVGEDYAVTVVNKEQLQEFFTHGKNLDGLYSVIEKKARGLVADPTTKDGASQIKSAARQLASVKKRIDEIGKDVVAELKALPNVIDDNRKKFRKDMEALQDEIRRPVTEIEEREDAIKDIVETHIACSGLTSEELATKIGEMEKAMAGLKPETWKESYDAAVKAYRGEISALKLLKETAEKREQEQRELAELRRKQEEADRIIREQKIKEEAAKRAKEEAEARAAADKARLEREKEEAERKAEEAEKARKEAEERAKTAAQEPQRPVPMSKTLPQPGAAKPSKWTDQQKAVNKAILVSFAEAVKEELPKYLSGFTDNGYKMASEAVAKRLVGSIVKGEIVNLEVRY